MTRRPRMPPAQLAAMPPRVTSASGVGTYGGLNSCVAQADYINTCQTHSATVMREQLARISCCTRAHQEVDLLLQARQQRPQQISFH